MNWTKGKLAALAAAFFIGGFLVGKEVAISSLVKDHCKTRVEIKEKNDFLYSEADGKSDYQYCVMYWTIERKGELK